MSNQLIIQVFGMIKSREVKKKQTDDSAYYSAYETDATLKVPGAMNHRQAATPLVAGGKPGQDDDTKRLGDRAAEEMKRLKA